MLGALRLPALLLLAALLLAPSGVPRSGGGGGGVAAQPEDRGEAFPGYKEEAAPGGEACTDQLGKEICGDYAANKMCSKGERVALHAQSRRQRRLARCVPSTLLRRDPHCLSLLPLPPAEYVWTACRKSCQRC